MRNILITIIVIVTLFMSVWWNFAEAGSNDLENQAEKIFAQYEEVIRTSNKHFANNDIRKAKKFQKKSIKLAEEYETLMTNIEIKRLKRLKAKKANIITIDSYSGTKRIVISAACAMAIVFILVCGYILIKKDSCKLRREI